MSWPLVELGSVLKVLGGFAFKSKDFAETGSKIIRISNISNGVVDLDDCALIPKDNVGKGERFKVSSGDILIAMSGATTGKIGVVPALLGEDIYLNQRVGNFIVDESHLDKSYLRFFLISDVCQTQINILAEGAAQPNVSGKDLESIKIPFPPLEIQKQIAAVLEKADLLRKDCKQMEQELNNLAQSVFIDMFGDPNSNSKNLPLLKISELGKVTTGNTPSRAKPEYYGEHIEWIKSDNINTPYDYLTVAKEYLSEEGLSVGRSVGDGSILMTCIAGSHDCIGNIAMTDRTVTFNQQINAISPDLSKVLTKFLYILLKVAKPTIQAASTKAMKGMVSKGKLEEVKLPIPPLEQQKKFIDLYEESLISLNVANNESIELNDLFSSIMQKAFKGELDLKAA